MKPVAFIYSEADRGAAELLQHLRMRAGNVDAISVERIENGYGTRAYGLFIIYDMAGSVAGHMEKVTGFIDRHRRNGTGTVVYIGRQMPDGISKYSPLHVHDVHLSQAFDAILGAYGGVRQP